MLSADNGESNGMEMENEKETTLLLVVEHHP